MRSRIFALLILIFNSFLCGAQTKNDLLSENIKGKVKSISETEYVFNSGLHSNPVCKKIREYNTAGNLIIEEIYEDTIKARDIITYDKQGYKTEREMTSYLFRTSNKTIYAFDTIKNVLQEMYYGDDGLLIRTAISKFDKKGNTTSMIIVNGDGSRRGKFEYRYDEKNRKTEEYTYSGDIDVIRKNFYKYDSLGNEIEMAFSDPWNKVNPITTYEYKDYDQAGNWLTKTSFIGSKRENKTTREIKYW